MRQLESQVMAQRILSQTSTSGSEDEMMQLREKLKVLEAEKVRLWIILRFYELR